MADLFAGNKVEGLTVPYPVEEYIRQAREWIVQDCTVEERLEGIPAEKRLEGIPLGQRHAGLTPAEREKLRLLLGDSPSS